MPEKGLGWKHPNPFFFHIFKKKSVSTSLANPVGNCCVRKDTAAFLAKTRAGRIFPAGNKKEKNNYLPEGFAECKENIKNMWRKVGECGTFELESGV